jgi:hypothetical protein
VEVLFAIAAAVGILTGALTLASWIAGKRRDRKRRKAEQALAPRPPDEPTYPVRLTCREETEFDPDSGFHEGLIFEVFNESDKPVTINGFGLEITMQAQGEWHEYEQARHHPPHVFPVRLEPHDGLQGYIQPEAVVEDIHSRGRGDYVVDWSPYVDVLGYGKKAAEVKKATG